MRPDSKTPKFKILRHQRSFTICERLTWLRKTPATESDPSPDDPHHGDLRGGDLPPDETIRIDAEDSTPDISRHIRPGEFDGDNRRRSLADRAWQSNSQATGESTVDSRFRCNVDPGPISLMIKMRPRVNLDSTLPVDPAGKTAT